MGYVMRHVVALVVAACLWATEAQAQVEQEEVLGCRSAEQLTELIDLLRDGKVADSHRRFRQLSRRPDRQCTVAPVGKVLKFEVVKTYHYLVLAKRFVSDAVVLRVEYQNGMVVYIVLDRVVGYATEI